MRWPRALFASVCSVLAMLVTTAALAFSTNQRDAEEALQSQDLRVARPLVEALWAEAPDDAFNLYLMGHLRLLEGKYEDATKLLNQAVALRPLPLFQHTRDIANQTWEATKNYIEYRTADGNFILAHAPGIDSVLLPYAEEALSQAWAELTRIFDFEPEAPIRVDFYPTVDVLGQVSPLTVAEIRTSGTIALCKYNRLMVTSPRDLVYGYEWLDTLAHEFIHLLISQKSKNKVPIWLHEGLAKYYEVKWRKEATPHLDRQSEAFLAKALANDTLISFEAMSPSMAKLPSQEATATAFAEVWTVIAYLNKQQGRDVAADLVAKMRDGKSDREAVSDLSKVPWDRFEKAWKGFLKAQNYRPLDTDMQTRLLFKGKDTELDELASIKIDSARDYVWLGDRMRLRERWKAAASEYAKAARVVGDKSPLIQGKLGYALLKLGAYEQAVTELKKPLDDASHHVVLYVYLGQALAKLKRWEEARQHLEFALTINPFDPDVHAALAEVYAALGDSTKASREQRHHALIHAQ